MSTIEVFNNMDEDNEIIFNDKFSDLSKNFCSQAGILDKDPTFFLVLRK